MDKFDKLCTIIKDGSAPYDILNDLIFDRLEEEHPEYESLELDEKEALWMEYCEQYSGDRADEVLANYEMSIEEFEHWFSCAETLEDAVSVFKAAQDFVYDLTYQSSNSSGRDANRLCCSLLYMLADKVDLDTFENRDAFVDAANDIASDWQVSSVELYLEKDIFDEEGEIEETVSAKPGEPGSYEVLDVDGARNGCQWDNEVPDTLAHILGLEFEFRDCGRFVYRTPAEA